MSADKADNSSWKSLAAYMLVLLFVSLCCIMLISQRMEIASRGKSISDLHSQAVKLRSQRAHLELEVAQKASYENLLAQMRRMGLHLVSPEEFREAGRARRP